MEEPKAPKLSQDLLGELQRLRKAADESFKVYVELQKKLTELQAKLETMPDGTMRAKGNR